MNDKIQEARGYLQAIEEATQELRELMRDILESDPGHKEMDVFRRLKASTEKIKGAL